MIKKYKQFNKSLLIESCGKSYSSCGSTEDTDSMKENEREKKIKSRRDKLKRVVSKCSDCGVTLYPDAEFCHKCGEKI